MIEIILTCTLVIGQMFTLAHNWKFESVIVEENIGVYWTTSGTTIVTVDAFSTYPEPEPGKTKIVISRQIKSEDAWKWRIPDVCVNGSVDGKIVK